MLIEEHYRIIKAIATRRLYQTFLAVNESQFPPLLCVVLKFPSSTQTPENFQHQVQQLIELGKHPQIPNFIKHCIQNEYYYLIQEFIPGDNLATLVEKQGVFNENQIWQVLHSVLPVLKFIHNHQVIHRNIKPENIILRSGNQDLLNNLALVDLGMMKILSNNQLEDNIVGSPEYISPEQIQGKAVFASDLYSLGLSCIYLLTQISPFELFDISQNSWVWRDYLTTPISEYLAQTLDKFIKNDLQERWQSADQLIYNLGIKNNSLKSTVDNHYWTFSHSLKNQISSYINTIALSHDHQILASGEDDKSVKLWNLNNQQLTANFTAHTQAITSVVFNHNDTILATASDDKTIILWDVQTLNKIHTLTGHSHTIKSLAFHPDGQILASASWDKTIKIWDINTGLELNTLTGHQLQVNAVTFSANGQLLASASCDRTARVWQLKAGKYHLFTTLTGHAWAVLTVAFSPTNHNLLATGSSDNTIKLWDVSTGELMGTLSDHSWSVVAVAFSSDGETLISGSWDKTIKIWQIKTNKKIASLTGHTDSISSVAMSQDGILIASGSRDKTIKLWYR
ncbi:MAG: protein kinase domain-containing protein [Cuspidothrix sp.]